MPENDDNILEQLDCEDEGQRLRRLNSLLSSIDSNSGIVPRNPLDSLLAQRTQDIDGTQTAQLLQRVQAFLPQLQAANQEVEAQARENPASVDIETFDGSEQEYIQLSLGLGLFEQRTGGGDDASSNDSGTSTEEESSSTSSDSDEDGSSSHEEEEEEEDPQPDLISLVTGTRPVLPLPKSRHSQRTTPGNPGIVVLSSSDAPHDSDHDA